MHTYLQTDEHNYKTKQTTKTSVQLPLIIYINKLGTLLATFSKIPKYIRESVNKTES